MTDDGTQGDLTLSLLHCRSKLIKFWPNGVDPLLIQADERLRIRQSHGCADDVFLLISLCRLESWKHVERSILVMDMLLKEGHSQKVKLVIIGDGGERGRLKALVDELGLGDYVEFMGALANTQARLHLAAGDIFISMYDLSNVGNPLLEALKSNLIPVTLANGDTGRWVQNGENGFIYDPSDEYISLAARDIQNLIDDPGLFARLRAGVQATAAERLWTWDQRLKAEISAVSDSIENRRRMCPNA
jgi:glycosyltransferase involved in cell wall biosynthesis